MIIKTKVGKNKTMGDYMKKVDFNQSETLKNLAKSFAGECMEGAKYQFLAQMCVTQKLNYLQTIFKTLAKHEMSHAKVFWDEIHQNYNGDIIQNINLEFGYPFDCTDLLQSINCHRQSEGHLATSLYPQFSKTATAEGYPDIAHKFDLVATVEECHTNLLGQIYKKLKGDKLYKSTKSQKWKCNQCGFEHTAKQPPELCPLCGYDKGYCQIPFDVQ